MSLSSRQRIIHCTAILILAVASFSLFSKSLNYPFSRIDDYSYVVNNGDIRRINPEMAKRWFTTDYVLLYVPVTMASFAMDYKFWKLDPFGYRLTNLVLHTVNGFLIYFLLAQITGSWLIAFWVSLIFIIHPAQVESVTWITERKNVLSTFFLLVAFHAYRRKYLLTMLLVAVLALLSKPSVSVLPLLLISHDYFIKPVVTGRKRIVLYGTLFGLAALASWVTVKFHASGVFYFRGGSFWSNLWVMMTVFFRYLELMVFPQVQKIFYVSEVYQSFWRLPVLLSAAGLCAIFAYLIRFHRQHRIICFAVMWYLILMAPVSNIFFPISTLMNDRYLYVSLVGFFAVIFLTFDRWTKQSLSQPRNLKQVLAGLILPVMFIAPFANQTWARLEDWKDQVGIYQTAMKGLSASDPRLRLGRAIDFYAKKDIESSIKEIDSILEYSQDEEHLLWQVQNYLMLNNFDKAVEYLRKIDRLPGSMRSAPYHDFYGQYYEYKKDYSKAEQYFLRAIEIDKKIPSYLHLAQMYLGSGEVEKAMKTYEEALKRDPDSSDALVEACKLYLDLQDYERAYALYRHLADLYPTDPFVVQISKLMNQYQK